MASKKTKKVSAKVAKPKEIKKRLKAPKPPVAKIVVKRISAKTPDKTPAKEKGKKLAWKDWQVDYNPFDPPKKHKANKSKRGWQQSYIDSVKMSAQIMADKIAMQNLNKPDQKEKEFLSSQHFTNFTKRSKSKEMVNHPSHYGGSENVYETIKVIEAWNLEDFCLGNTIKYISRAGKKHESKEGIIEDLKKAQFYLNRKISNLEKVK